MLNIYEICYRVGFFDGVTQVAAPVNTPFDDLWKFAKSLETDDRRGVMLLISIKVIKREITVYQNEK